MPRRNIRVEVIIDESGTVISRKYYIVIKFLFFELKKEIDYWDLTEEERDAVTFNEIEMLNL